MSIKSVLDIDMYKLTMQQIAWKYHKDAVVKYELINRNPYDDLTSIYYLLQYELSLAAGLKFGAEDIAYLASLELFEPDFLHALQHEYKPVLPIARITEDKKLEIVVEGPWWQAILWETMIMSIVSELAMNKRFGNSGLNLSKATADGTIRLLKKIDLLQNHNVVGNIIDFGTRRRFGANWHETALDIFRHEAGHMLVGTSNVYLAKKYGLKPVGTYAHEMDMVYLGLTYPKYSIPAHLHISHNLMMDDWESVYPSLDVALADTWTSDWFFKNSPHAHTWYGLRQDSGDPFKFAEKAVEWWKANGEDPLNHTVVFSDNLNAQLIVDLDKYCRGVLGFVPMFGWGSDFMNDCGIPRLNIVVKATSVNGVPLVKLSDDLSKATGPQEKIEEVVRMVEDGME